MLLGIFGALILGGAVFYIVYTTQKAAENSAAENRLAMEWGSDRKAFQPPFYLSLTKPLLQGGTLDLAAGFWNEKRLADWKRKIIAAGWGRHVEPIHVVAAKFWLTLIVGLSMFLMYVFSDQPPAPWVPPAFTLLAFFYPNLHMSGLRTKRQHQVRMAMPYVVDLLTLSIEAGLDFMGAIGKVVDRAPPSALLEELSVLLKDIQLGKTRAEALRAMADRLDMSEMSSFVAILVSSDAMGASIGNVLRAQSETMRSERLMKAEKLGAAASQKILVPLVFLILPSVMLMIFGPIVLQMMGVK